MRYLVISDIHGASQALEQALTCLPESFAAQAAYYDQTVIPAMHAARSDADLLERLTDKSFWPFPTYSDLLFYL